MESWQVVLVSLATFVTIGGAVIGINLFLHPTKEEVNKIFDKAFQHFQTKEKCDLYHASQDIRNCSFTNTMIEIKEEIKEIKQDIKEALRHWVERS